MADEEMTGTPEPGAEPAADAAGAVESATLNELEKQGGQAPAAGAKDMSLDMILDVGVTLSIELGRANMSIRDLLKLNQGSIVDLDRMAGEPLDVLVNGTLIARGEVVVVKDKFGLMLTEVVSPEERVRRLH